MGRPKEYKKARTCRHANIVTKTGGVFTTRECPERNINLYIEGKGYIVNANRCTKCKAYKART